MPVLGDLALLLARVSLGIILMAHGWQKFTEWTLAGTAQSFEAMGAPAPSLTSALTAIAELVGGGMLILGLLTPLVAIINVVIMLGALLLVHTDGGVFVGNGGFELVLGLAAGLLVLAAFGAGRFSIDAALPGSRSRSRTRGTARPVAARAA